LSARRLRPVLIGLCAASLLAIPTPALAAAPANDNFANAEVITGLSGSASGSNVDATEEPGEPNNAAVSAPIQSVWYAWTAPETTTIRFDTCTSDWDTTLGIYAGPTVQTLSLVADNDDGDSCGANGESELAFEAVSGTTYHVSVDGFWDHKNPFTLRWGYPPPRADLSVVTTDSADPVEIGTDVTYTMVVSNAGPDPATDVTLHARFVRSGAHVSESTSQGSCVVRSTWPTDDVECAIGTIDSGQSVTITMTVKTANAGIMTNTATIYSSNNQADADSEDRSDYEPTDVLINSLRNPSFEMDKDGNRRPDSWTSNAKFTRREVIVIDGSFSGRHRATDDSGYAIQQTVSGLGSGHHKFVGFVNIPSTSDKFTLRLVIRWRNNSNGLIGTTTIESISVSTSGWLATRKSVIAPRGTRKAQIRMGVSSLNTTIYVDGFLFGASEEPITEPPASPAG
jgi:hypothetical protein